MKIRTPHALAGLILGLMLTLPAQAALQDVTGTNYNFDANTGLYWLDVTATRGLSFNEVAGGAGRWTTSGWRYATGDEVNQLFSANLPSLYTTTNLRGLIDPMVGDYYAPRQVDSSGEAARLMDVLGGNILNPDFPPHLGVKGALLGLFDRDVTCTDSGCSPAHAVANIRIFSNNEAWVITPGGATADFFGFSEEGSLLVSTTPTLSVPEPETYAMMLAGLGLLGVVARRRRQKLTA